MKQQVTNALPHACGKRSPASLAPGTLDRVRKATHFLPPIRRHRPVQEVDQRAFSMMQVHGAGGLCPLESQPGYNLSRGKIAQRPPDFLGNVAPADSPAEIEGEKAKGSDAACGRMAQDFFPIEISLALPQ